MPSGVYIRSDKVRQEMSHRMTGRIRDKSPAWNGGKFIDKDGYVMVLMPEHKFCNTRGYVREHRLVMEKKLGRYLEPNEVVHHIDKNRKNNNIDNLQLFKSNGEHTRLENSKDLSDRICSNCGSSETAIKKNGRPYWCRGMCRKCYRRWQRYG